MSNTFLFAVLNNEKGIRIDKYISLKIEKISRSAAAKLIDEGAVKANGNIVEKNYKCREDDRISVIIPQPVALEAKAENIPLDIVYEDKDLLVVNKPKGMVVHPAAGNYTGTLVNALLYYCGSSLSGINGVLRPGIVHRIDKDTSGLLIVAKNDFAHAGLALQIKEHSFERAYECVACGNIKENVFTVSQPIGRNPKDRKKMAVTFKNSKNAVTHINVIKRYSEYTHCRCTLETGRTHQIRVHMAYIGHPIAGDEVYGYKKSQKGLNGQCLHAKHIGFIHPRTGRWLEFESDLPEYFTQFLNKIEKSK
ncbi:MAG: RluA family pseudouridine synthase [Clostridiales bacterium]|nr:RluA family pseudouridine synthase [Clostridiales bacterium]